MRFAFICAALLAIAAALPAAVAQTGTAHGIALAWQPVSGATSYNVYRCAGTCTATSTGWAQIGGASSPGYLDPESDTALAVGSTYSYAVTSVEAGEESAFSNVATVTLAAWPVSPPPPQGATAKEQ